MTIDIDTAAIAAGLIVFYHEIPEGHIATVAVKYSTSMAAAVSILDGESVQNGRFVHSLGRMVNDRPSILSVQYRTFRLEMVGQDAFMREIGDPVARIKSSVNGNAVSHLEGTAIQGMIGSYGYKNPGNVGAIDSCL